MQQVPGAPPDGALREGKIAEKRIDGRKRLRTEDGRN